VASVADAKHRCQESLAQASQSGRFLTERRDRPTVRLIRVDVRHSERTDLLQRIDPHTLGRYRGLCRRAWCQSRGTVPAPVFYRGTCSQSAEEK
jgi:hypothetical protein